MLKFAGALIVVYVGLIGFLYLFQRQFIYFPDRTRPDPAAYGVPDMAPVTLITADGIELLAWWRPAARADAPVMAFFHGNAGNIGYRGPKVRPYLDDGWGVLLTAWRGYSGNTGDPSENGLYADGRSALDFLAARGVDPEKLVIYGESLGAGVSVQMALERPVAAMILEAPFTSIADMAQHRFPFVPARALVRDRFASLSKIGQLRIPVMVIHGEDDAIVPLKFGQRLFEAVNPPKTPLFVPGGGHNDLHDFGISTAVKAFVDEFVNVQKHKAIE